MRLGRSLNRGNVARSRPISAQVTIAYCTLHHAHSHSMGKSIENSASCLPDDLLSRPQARPGSPGHRDEKSTSRDLLTKPTGSIFAGSDSAPIHDVPMRVIHRPLPSELDEDKVTAFMAEMKVRDIMARQSPGIGAGRLIDRPEMCSLR